jgi:hypothetical protein
VQLAALGLVYSASAAKDVYEVGFRPTECGASAANRKALPRCREGDVRGFKLRQPVFWRRAAPLVRVLLQTLDVFRFHAAIGTPD